MVKKTISKKIKKNVLDYLKHLKDDGLNIDKVFIFGSYAKGTQNKWSDIDLCVISSDFKENKNPLIYLWTKKRIKDINAMISPIAYHPFDFVNEDPLVWEIKKTGIEIFLKK